MLPLTAVSQLFILLPVTTNTRVKSAGTLLLVEPSDVYGADEDLMM
jgi:hypothetical protein